MITYYAIKLPYGWKVSKKIGERVKPMNLFKCENRLETLISIKDAYYTWAESIDKQHKGYRSPLYASVKSHHWQNQKRMQTRAVPGQ